MASDVGGHRELIRDGETGILFRSDNADDLSCKALSLLSNPDRRAALRAAARSFVETQRNWQSSVARYQSIYDSLILKKQLK